MAKVGLATFSLRFGLTLASGFELIIHFQTSSEHHLYFSLAGFFLFFCLLLPRPPRVAPRPRTTPAGAAPPTPFPMSLSTATLLTDMEKFLCMERERKRERERERMEWKRVECAEFEPSCKLTNRLPSWGGYHVASQITWCVNCHVPAPPQWEARVPVAAWAHLAE